jgi:hypothetical protein
MWPLAELEGLIAQALEVWHTVREGTVRA